MEVQDNELLQAALQYAEHGIAVFPLVPKDKRPLTKNGFYNATTDKTQIYKWWTTTPSANIGIPTGAINDALVVDVDPKNGGDKSYAQLTSTHGEPPLCPRANTGSGGWHLWFRYSATVKSSTGTVAQGIDIQSDGKYVVAPPSVHPNGTLYIWQVSPIGSQRPMAPAWLVTPTHRPIARSMGEPMRSIAEGYRNDSLFRFAAGMRRHGAGEQEIEAALLARNALRCAQPLDEREIRSIANSASRYAPAESALVLPLTDAGNAEYFAHLNANSLRYDHRQQRWLIWRKHFWAADSDGAVERCALNAVRTRALSSEMFTDAEYKKAFEAWMRKSESRSKLDATTSIAQNLRPIATDGTEWDSEPWLLAVANGVVDLRTGELREGKPEDRITLHTSVSFNPQAKAPLWEKFLSDVFGEDAELIRFVRRAIGYSATGSISEQVFFVCHGKGANGKSVFLAVLRHVLGQYAHVLPFSTFDIEQRNSIPADIAGLVGRRFVWASEAGESSRLNEARIKSIVHGDEISARPLYKDFFLFNPQAKLWFAVNHKPTVKDESLGFWRSVRMIPFLNQFTGDKADKNITSKLIAEAEGILAWAVNACLEYQEHGLAAPEIVLNATQEYQTESDVLGEFLADCCVQQAGLSTYASELFSAYEQWATNTGISDRERLSSTNFGRQIRRRFDRKRTASGHRYLGIGLKSDSE